MLLKASWVRLACVLVVIGWAAGAAAQKVAYPLGGNGGFWIGLRTPIPVAKGPPPNQALQATRYASVLQTTGPDPVKMYIRPGKLTKPLGRRYAGQFRNTPLLWMVSTTLSVQFPAPSGVGTNTPNADGTAVFFAGGRTGPPTYTWCPGPTRPCTPSPPTPAKGVTGVLTYKATKNQFGGPAQAQILGKATMWFRPPGFSAPPCKHTAFAGTNPLCLAVRGYANPAPLGGIGAPFGYFTGTTPVAVYPNIFVLNVPGTTGTIKSASPAASTAFKNSARGYGAPWTTGRVTIVQPGALPFPTFTLTGSDKRVSGVGHISLVAGSIINRVVTGPEVGRGWLNLRVKPRWQEAPALSGWGIALFAFLLAGFGAAGASLARRKR